MSKIEYKKGLCFNEKHIKKLYEDAGWYTYTKNIEKLMKAIQNSLYVITAWDEDELVGLLRIVGDGVSIIYIQDILVLKSHKRCKIGTIMLEKMFEAFPNIRHKVLLTDDSEETRGFYEAIGFTSCDKGNLVAFAKID